MILVDCKQYDDRWWEERRGRPSASNFHRILTPKKWEFAAAVEKYAIDLIAELYDWNYGPQDEYQTAAMRNGTILEPEARRYYEFRTDAIVDHVGCCLTDDKRFLCSPDGLVGDDGGLEAKCPIAATQIRWLLDGGLPAEHKAQVHGGLIVTGRKWWDFLSHCPGLPPILIRVEPDKDTEKLAAALDDFWDLYQVMLAQIKGQPDEVRNQPRPDFVSPF